MGPDCFPGGDDSAITHFSIVKVELNAPPTNLAAAAASNERLQPNASTDRPDDSALSASSGLRPSPASLARPQSIDVRNCASDQHAAIAPVSQPIVASLLPSGLIERTRKTARA